MTTDNRTNEQIVAEAMASRSNGGPSTWFKEADLAVAALKAAGRLAGEPSDAQLNAATHALSEYLNDNAPIGEAQYRGPARAALVAAAGVAPQAESDEDVKCRCGHGVGSHDFSEPQERCRLLGCRCQGWYGIAPVRQVSESDLAEVIYGMLPIQWRIPKPEKVAQNIARAVVEAIGGEA